MHSCLHLRKSLMPIALGCLMWCGLPAQAAEKAPARQDSANSLTKRLELPTVAKPVTVKDVALAERGVLAGSVLNRQGKGIAGAVVSLRSQGKEVARIHTDREGRFQLRGMRGGLFEARVMGMGHVYRVWTANAAPPIAKPDMLLVIPDHVVRGQRPIGSLFNSRAMLVGAVTATAVAVPIAVHNSDDDKKPAS